MYKVLSGSKTSRVFNVKELLVLFSVLLLLGCSSKTEEVNMKSVSHKNGLLLDIPEDISDIQETNEGFKLQLSDPDRRLFNSISVQLLDTNPYATINLKERYMGSAVYLYSEEKYEGGSGGAEYKLSIWKKLPSNDALGVAITQDQQSERDVDYDLAWRIAESATLAR